MFGGYEVVREDVMRGDVVRGCGARMWCESMCVRGCGARACGARAWLEDACREKRKDFGRGGGVFKYRAKIKMPWTRFVKVSALDVVFECNSAQNQRYQRRNCIHVRLLSMIFDLERLLFSINY